MRIGAIVAVMFVARGSHAAPPAHFTAWETAWTAARGCLVGDPQLTVNPIEARALQQELGAGNCKTALLAARQVAREGASDPGFHVVWSRVVTAIEGFAADDFGDLFTYLGELDKADDALRTAAHQPPVARTMRVIPTLALAPPIDQGPGDRVTVENHQVVDHALVALVEQPSQGRTTIQRRVNVLPPGRASERAQLDWDAAFHDGQFVVGPITPDNQISVEATLMRGPRLHLSGTFGADRERSVVVHGATYANEPGPVWIIRSRDAGVHWGHPVAIGTPALTIHTRSFSDAIDLFWQRPGSATVVWQAVDRPGALPPTRSLPSGQGDDFDNYCLADGVLWWSEDDEVHVSDARGDRTIATTIDTPSVLACTARSAAISNQKGVMACTTEHCDTLVEHDDVAVFADIDETGRVVTVGWLRTGYLVVSMGSTHQLFRTEPAKTAGLAMQSVVLWGGRPHLVFASDASGQVEISITPVPQ